MQDKKIGTPLKAVAPFCRTAAAQGAVLLKNEGGMLPIKKEDRLAIFGRCQIDYYRSGTGSGGAVNVEYATNLLDGLGNYPWVNLNKTLIEVYKNWIQEHPFKNGGGGWAAEPWNQEEMPLSDELVKEIARSSNKAIIVIGRTAGEDQDNLDEPGSYRLTEEEKNMINVVTRYFSQTAVILNVSNIIDMSWTLQDWCHGNIKSLLYTWHGGIEGGNATADLLVGEVSPSGHLSDTIAYSLEDYPAFSNYGNDDYNLYQEDIYVGYRYFETFCPEKVMYPFGFGLSYTTFAVEQLKGQRKGSGIESKICIGVKVTNTGDYSGKEVVQVYVEAPQGKLGKPKKVLINFAKTHLLAPGESQELMLETEVSRFASYDDSGVTGYKSAYVLEEGNYRFHMGTDCRNTTEIQAEEQIFKLEKLLVVKEVSEAAAPIKPFTRIKPGKVKNGVYEIVYEPVPLRTIDLEKRILDHLPAPLPQPERTDITFREVKEGKASLEAFTAQLSVKELAAMVRGEGMCSNKVTPGTAAAFGGISDELVQRGVPVACAADGPSGIRMDTGGTATQLPIGTLLACSFDGDLVEELFYLEGQEMVQNQIDALLGPGINIHRYPLNGRNFEYFSEDPYVTGIFAIACEKGMKRAGTTGTLKHFACNNQERNRHVVDSVLSERALREIYLKGFEMAVEEGSVSSIMTTYNPMNGYQNASGYDLNTTILRGEWGYQGIVMTDWWARINDVLKGGKGKLTDLRSMLRSQNDVYMVVNNDGAAINSSGDNIETALLKGSLTLGELQRSAMNILRFLIDTKASEREPRVVMPVEVDPLPGSISVPHNAKSIKKKINVRRSQTQKGSILLRVDHDGIYNILVDIRSEQRMTAQMLCQLYLNNIKTGDIQTNGTGGNWFKQRAAKAELRSGLYEMTLKHIRPGIEISYIEFVEA